MGTDPDNYDAVVYYFKKPTCRDWSGSADLPGERQPGAS